MGNKYNLYVAAPPTLPYPAYLSLTTKRSVALNSAQIRHVCSLPARKLPRGSIRQPESCPGVPTASQKAAQGFDPSAVAWVKFGPWEAAQGFQTSPPPWVRFCRFPEVPITKLSIISGRSSGRGCRTPPRARRSQTAGRSARKPPRGTNRQRSPGSSLGPRVPWLKTLVFQLFQNLKTPPFWGSSGKRGPS